MSCLDCLVQVTYQADLSSPTCLYCPVPAVQSRMSCPVPVVLSQLSCPSCPPVPAALPGHLVHCSLDTTDIFWQSYDLCPFQAHLSRLTCQTDLSRRSCPDCPVPTVLSCPGCPILAVLSERSCPRCHVPDILLSSLKWHGCSIPVVLSQLDVLSQISSLNHHGCSIPVVLS